MQNLVKYSIFNSLRVKTILWALVFVLPIFAILLVSSNHSSSLYKEQVRENIQQTITPYVKEIDATLESVQRYVGSSTIDFSLFGDQAGMDALEMINHKEEIGDNLAKDITVYPLLESFFIYQNSHIDFVYNYNCDYTENRKAATTLQNYFDSQTSLTSLFQQGYQCFESNGNYYIYIAVNVDTVVFGAWFSADKLLDNILKADISGLSYVMFADHAGRILNEEFYTPSAKKQAALLSDFLIVEERLSVAPFTLIALMDRDTVFLPFNQLTRNMYLMLILAALLIAFYFIFLQHTVIKPLGKLIKAIKKIKKGDFSPIAIRERESLEIRNVFEALNAMTSEVEALKIKVYEEKLIKQRTQMQMFQLQLRPHLFLNALNTIISYARSQQYRLIQKMTFCLADHCRYILYNNWFVSVEEELMYTQNYINMLSMQHDTKFHYKVHVDDLYLDWEIPILGIQIFVENALKHSRNVMGHTWIEVSISETIYHSVPCLHVAITDSGGGFDPETLELLNNAQEIEPKKKDSGIGIENIRQRLFILYNGQANIVFSNNEQGGAHIEMYLPTTRKRIE